MTLTLISVIALVVLGLLTLAALVVFLLGKWEYETHNRPTYDATLVEELDDAQRASPHFLRRRS